MRYVGAIFCIVAWMSFGSRAEQVELRYMNWRGDFFTGDSFSVEMDISKESVGSALATIKNMYGRKRGEALVANLVFVGYSDEKEASIGDYFAASSNMNDYRSLYSALPSLPEKSDGKWFFMFINPWASPHAQKNSDDHPSSSPFYPINRIGKAATYF